MVAPKWRWLLLALAAVTVGCLVPGSMLTQPPTTSGGATIVTPAAPAPSGSECAAVSCNRGSPTSTAALPGITLAGTVAAGILVVVALCAIRRVRRGAVALPAGSPSRLLRPPQQYRAFA